jgi:peptidoglycan hydrolase-like protein with peptidoglycan-binding domain
MRVDPVSPGRRSVLLTTCIVIVGAAVPGDGSAQTTPVDPQAVPPMGAMGGMSAMGMIMPTNNHKVFRMIRPTMAAIQLQLLEAGMFSGSANGLLGPSTFRALSTYQRSRGLEVTSLPDGPTVLDLMGLQGRFSEIQDHLEMQMTSSSMAGDPMAGHQMADDPMADPMAGHQMNMGEMQGGMASEGPRVDGDPQPAKSLILMQMPDMVMDNRHTRSVRAVREVVASLQLRLRDEGLFDGMANGFLEEPGFADAVRRYQARLGVDETGIVDLATALYLLGSDGERVISQHRDRIDLEATPVAMDGDLIRLSNGRLQRSPPNRERNK